MTASRPFKDPSQPLEYTTAVAPPRAQSADLRMGTTATPGTDYKYVPNIPFKPERGFYFFSQWQHIRYFYTSFENGTDYLGTLPWVLPAENDLLIAEALVRTNGDKARAATLINKTRVGRGGLTPLTSTSSTNDMLAAIFYERDV
ncbi:MAG: RagB/SusD family nutrient uptake outer membrane protein, partial [Gemmatimonadales bacterium]